MTKTTRKELSNILNDLYENRRVLSKKEMSIRIQLAYQYGQREAFLESEKSLKKIKI